MSYWLLKTEPSTYGFADLERERRTAWTGVANPLAQKHLKAIRPGDELLIYHTGSEKAVVGVARAVGEPYPDPKSPKLAVVDLEPVHRLKTAVTLAELKAAPAFADFALVRLPRLSVMPVPPALWREILKRGAA